MGFFLNTKKNVHLGLLSIYIKKTFMKGLLILLMSFVFSIVAMAAKARTYIMEVDQGSRIEAPILDAGFDQTDISERFALHPTFSGRLFYTEVRQIINRDANAIETNINYRYLKRAGTARICCRGTLFAMQNRENTNRIRDHSEGDLS